MSEIYGQVVSIAGVLALLCALVWWMGRRGRVSANQLVARWSMAFWTGRKTNARVMEIVESRTLSPGQALHLVRVGERCVVLASHGAGCTLIESCRWEDLVRPRSLETQTLGAESCIAS